LTFRYAHIWRSRVIGHGPAYKEILDPSENLKERAGWQMGNSHMRGWGVRNSEVAFSEFKAAINDRPEQFIPLRLR
jgi:hypothetical protein